MHTLRAALIYLAHKRADLRPHLLPLLRDTHRVAWSQTPEQETHGEWVLKWNSKQYRTILVEHPDWSDAAVLQGSKVVYDNPDRVPPDVRQAVVKMFRRLSRA